MVRRIGRQVSIVAAVLTMAASVRAQSVADLLPFVPRDANAISVFRVHALTGSPRGVKEGWAARHESQYLDGAVTIPPWVEVMVRASYVRPGTRGGDWTVVLLPLPAQYEMSMLSQREGTEVQEISSHAAVLSQRYSGYFVELKGAGEGGARVLGGMSPATRQDVSRWLTESHQTTGTTGLSPYLVEAAADETAQIVLAVDMQEMLDPVHVRNRLNAAEALKKEAGAKAALTIAFQTIRGMRLSVRVGETSTAEVRMDFGRQIGSEGQFVKPLLVEFLNDAGAALDELESAQVETKGRTVTMTMPLSDESLRRILSLVTAPPPPSGPGRTAGTPTPPQPAAESGAVDVNASRRYWLAVNRNVDDLQKAYGRAQSYTRTAHWHENFAQRIENLPSTGVDPALLEYGRTVAARLRALGASLRGTGVQVNALDRSVVYNVDVTPAYQTGFDWWWGGARTAWGPYTYGQPQNVNITSNLGDVRAKQAEIVNASAPQREQIWNMINEERAAVERAMVGKYGEEFQNR